MSKLTLKEIVEALAKPASDIRAAFALDLCALLEDYRSRAGLRAIVDHEEPGPSDRHHAPMVPNFAELALIIQRSAGLYGRRVDLLYRYAIDVSGSIQNGTVVTVDNRREPQVIARNRRRRAPTKRAPIKRAQGKLEFIPIELERSTKVISNSGPSKPPPMLPRRYMDLEPRVPSAADAQLQDYLGNPIGVLSDFYVCRRLQNGFLVEDLYQPEGGEVVASSLRTRPLAELQAAFEAAAPPDFEPRGEALLPKPEHSDPEESQPRPLAYLDLSGIIGIPNRKRKHNVASLEEYFRHCFTKLTITQEGQVKRKRKIRVSTLTTELRSEESAFVGSRRRNKAKIAKLAPAGAGLLERSAMAEDANMQISVIQHQSEPDGSTVAANEEWQQVVAQRAARQEGQIVDIHAIAQTLLLNIQKEWNLRIIDMGTYNEHPVLRGYNSDESTKEHIEQPVENGVTDLNSSDNLVPYSKMFGTAESGQDVSRRFLALLFLANAGNVEIVQGPPLTMNSFSVRLLSTDEFLYRLAIDAEKEPKTL